MTRAPVYDVDVGGEWLIPLAKKRLAQMEQRRRLTGVAFLKARVYDDGASTADVEAGETTHRIRIRAASVTLFAYYNKVEFDASAGTLRIYDSFAAFDDAKKRKWQIDMPSYLISAGLTAYFFIGCSADASIVLVGAHKGTTFTLFRISGGVIDAGTTFDFSGVVSSVLPSAGVVNSSATRAFFVLGTNSLGQTVAMYYAEDVSPAISAHVCPLPGGIGFSAPFAVVGGKSDLSAVYVLPANFLDAPVTGLSIPFRKVEYVAGSPPEVVSSTGSMSTVPQGSGMCSIGRPKFSATGGLVVPYRQWDGPEHTAGIPVYDRVMTLDGDDRLLQTYTGSWTSDEPPGTCTSVGQVLDDGRGYSFSTQDTDGFVRDGATTVVTAGEKVLWLVKGDKFIVMKNAAQAFVRGPMGDVSFAPLSTVAALADCFAPSGATSIRSPLVPGQLGTAFVSQWKATTDADGAIVSYNAPVGVSAPPTIVRQETPDVSKTLNQSSSISVYPMKALGA